MIIARKSRHGFMRIWDVFYATSVDECPKGVDVINLYQCAVEYPGSKRFHTLFIDLTQSVEDMMAGVSKRYRTEIRKAGECEDILYRQSYSPQEEEVEAFLAFYNRFAASKSLTPCDPERVCQMLRQKALMISTATTRDGETLVQHVYFVDTKRARIQYSCSLVHTAEADSTYRNMVARANRYLHWLDMMSIKACGIPVYDFGGLTLDPNRPEMDNIDAFKMGFGGQVVDEFHCRYGRSWLGRLVLKLTGKDSSDM